MENISLTNDLFLALIFSVMLNDFLMEARHFIKTLCKQKVKTFFLCTLIALNVKWVPRVKELRNCILSIICAWSLFCSL